MFGKTKIALSAAMVLSTAFPASAATKHHRVTHVHPAIYNTAPAARSDDTARGARRHDHEVPARQQLASRNV